MTPLPRWSDEKAVAKKVADEIEDGRSEISSTTLPTSSSSSNPF